MFQAVVVDDKKMIREGLTKHIPWEELGYRLLGAAQDAAEAISLIEQHCADVLITDIVMPNMNGLELIQAVKLVNPTIKIVILSAYDRFDYAQKAILLGAHCYLTKPVDLDELQEELLTLKNILKQEEEDRRQSHLFLHIARSQFFDSLISGEEKSDDEIRQKAQRLNLYFPKEEYILTELHFCDHSKKGEIFPQMLRALQKAGETFCVKKESDRAMVLLFPFSSSGLEEQLNGFCAAFQKEKLCLSVSNPRFALTELPDAIRETKRAMEYKVMQKYRTVYFYDKIQKLFERKMKLSPQKEEQLLCSLSEQDLCKYESCVKELISQYQFRESGEIPYEAYLAIILCTNHYLEESSESGSPFAGTDRTIHQILLAPGAEAAQAVFMTFASECFSLLKHNCRKISNQIVERAMEYIRDHYPEEITLQRLSQEVYVNPMYLSRLFKEKASISYIDYLTQIRMSHAKKLLEDLSLRIYDISEMVGYESRKHFGKVFKDFTGMSPKDYRNSVLLEQE